MLTLAIMSQAHHRHYVPDPSWPLWPRPIMAIVAQVHGMAIMAQAYHGQYGPSWPIIASMAHLDRYI
jgi:hypothetical protein